MKYSEYFMSAIANLGFTHCFYVGGGNSMHLLESASHRFKCVPVVHEVTAAIAAEYFNESNPKGRKAFALVTAGPGFTNLVTGLAGAWLDSRELLVVGGQAKSTNLAKGTVRQMGHQEVDGVAIASSISKKSMRIEEPYKQDTLNQLVSTSWTERPGPVFVEVCLDVSAMEVDWQIDSALETKSMYKSANYKTVGLDQNVDFLDLIRSSKRPLILLGGGVKREAAKSFLRKIEEFRIPVACTWTGADRVGTSYPFFAGRPNTYGMRWANIFQQQADLLIAVGTSLGFQQTGFNTEDYLPAGQLIHVDIDKNELTKPFPKSRLAIQADSTVFLRELSEILQKNPLDTSDWADFLDEVKKHVPTFEECQRSSESFVSPHEVMARIQSHIDSEDCVVAASSGGTFTAAMQIISTRDSQVFIGNKGLASMGYGLAGAIGCALAKPNSRVVLFEGDGGFAQNMQDLGTVIANDLNIKIFITCNDGYASIRTSQKNYFDGHYLGCDRSTGLYLPDWKDIARAYQLPLYEISGPDWERDEFTQAMRGYGPYVFLIKADSEQMYLPKIFSKVNKAGQMSSTALHDMSPSLNPDLSKKVFKFIEAPKS